VRVVCVFSPPVEHGSPERHTLVVDLATDEDRLLEQMSKSTRYKILRAMQKDPLRVTAAVEPSTAAVEEFSDFYDRSASAHRCRRLFRDRGYGLHDFGGLDVTGRSEKTARIAQFKQGFCGEVRPVYSSTSARSLLGAAVQRILGLRGVDF
jgi:lipid II:glycine glycyltransferase (peptidoglycan interpeptide bridge formation enzyme)